MRHGLALPTMAPVDRLVGIAVTAEENGWDAVLLDDHLRMPAGSGLEPHDPWVLLGAIAQATERIRVGTAVTPLTRRRPQKVAKEVVTLDHLSGGRAVLGVGLGNLSEEEFTAFGDAADLRVQAERTDEALSLLDRFWTGASVDHDGPHFRAAGELRPRPVQRPRPPIWVACGWPARRPLERARRYDGVLAIDTNRGYLEPADTDELVAALGEVPDTFAVVVLRAPDQRAAAYADAGADWPLEARPPTGTWLEELEAAAAAGPGAPLGLRRTPQP